ncbi:DUF3732 domain-containing protein [Stenotrophomonas maltophilia]|uniref:DUF3732 domain-containing protein n=1 Tax=Stenotrophomonas maltophilia TaxID=40324 RepID=UPI002895BF7F|nr:DUF3732 domain-containing protein [Stenotrophomonas maltophilia]MDT3430833.1 DUF3732 domain-containing protein [Stenotrophomonas maltophilia]
MNFGFDKIVLWSKNGECRSLDFKRNRVNVISGESHTGKSALLDIIDYCFLASSHKLPDSIINENVAWYGIVFYVNEKVYAIARRSPEGNKVSSEYFFSSIGELPDAPVQNAREDDIRKIIESEFGIDGGVVVPFGGGAIRAGSKVSFRYFLMFNTISEDIITNSKVFFDKQSEDRYREALPRIFDMALGIDDLGNMAARERRDILGRELAKALRRESQLRAGQDDFDGEIRTLASRAAEYGIFDSSANDFSREAVRDAIERAASVDTGKAIGRRAEISAELFSVDKRLRQLRQFSADYKEYKRALSLAEDSLLPVNHLIKNAPLLIKSEIFDGLLASLKFDLSEIRRSTSRKQPVDGQVGAIIDALTVEQGELRRELEALPEEPRSFESEREKWLFVGETKGRLSVFDSAPKASSIHLQPSADQLQNEIDSINVRDVEETRASVVSMINEIAQDFLAETGAALANYSRYQTDFSYKEKRLRLRKPRSSLIENVGSSSNHMFLHLLQFLALHEVAISHDSPFVPRCLIIDQPSRPYYPDDGSMDGIALDNSDSEKVSIAFKLLSDFVGKMNREYSAQFQMIVFEHVPKATFEGMEYVHLLPEFRGGEALIPRSWLR